MLNFSFHSLIIYWNDLYRSDKASMLLHTRHHLVFRKIALSNVVAFWRPSNNLLWGNTSLFFCFLNARILVSTPPCLIFSANSSDEYIGKFMLLNSRYLCNIRNFRKISFFYIIISSNWIISIMKIICWKVKITIFYIKYVESQTL